MGLAHARLNYDRVIVVVTAITRFVLIATSVLSVHYLKVTGNVSSWSFEEFLNFFIAMA